MKNLPITLLLVFIAVVGYGQTPCNNGFAGPYPCKGYDLMSQITLSTMNAGAGNDSWGWTDPSNGKEYAIIGLNNGTAFIDISNPTNPVYLGKLPTATVSSSWRDMKVYQNHAFIVSEASNHGMQVFDLTRLRNVSNPPVNFTADTRYTEFGNAHNIVINEDTGYAYVVGAQRNGGTYSGGPLFINIQNPKNPINAGGFRSGGQRAYTHDAQVVTYTGPDATYQGREILIGSNEIEVVIADITDKSNPVTLATIRYADVGYTHQGWFTEDMRYFILGDETDEQRVGFDTRTIVFDFLDLDNPRQHMIYNGPTAAIDHNGYVKDDTFYLANYRAGIRVIDISSIGSRNMTEVGFFDTFPSSNGAAFNGVWNVYPYFESGNIVISDIEGGFFLVRKSNTGTPPPTGDCANEVGSFPYNESFEGSIGDWAQASGDDLDWTVDANGTPSNGTGPSGAIDGNSYIYVEASGNGTGFPTKNAILNSPCFDFRGINAPNLNFQYHMIGSAVGTLNIEARTDNSGAWESVFSLSGAQGTDWNAASINLSDYAGEASVQLRLNVVTGNSWQGDITIDALSITNGGTNPGSDCEVIDFNDFTINSFTTNQDGDGDFSVTNGGDGLSLSNNTWKSIAFNYEVTANTVLEFDFTSSSQGEIHAVGFEDDNALTQTRYFKVHGTQNYGITNFDNYAGGTATYVIPVGNFYTGAMDRLVFINDNDTGSGNNSSFSNVKIYEGSCGNISRQDIISQPMTVSVGDTFEDDASISIKVYPNPASSALNVSFATQNVFDYEIKSITGQLIGTGKVSNNTEIDISNLQVGVYFLQVTMDNKELIDVKRFVKM